MVDLFKVSDVLYLQTNLGGIMLFSGILLLNFQEQKSKGYCTQCPDILYDLSRLMSILNAAGHLLFVAVSSLKDI